MKYLQFYDTVQQSAMRLYKVLKRFTFAYDFDLDFFDDQYRIETFQVFCLFHKVMHGSEYEYEKLSNFFVSRFVLGM